MEHLRFEIYCSSDKELVLQVSSAKHDAVWVQWGSPDKIRFMCVCIIALCVTIDAVWIGEWIYSPLIYMTRNYNKLQRHC
jgi:hypothetical protein